MSATPYPTQQTIVSQQPQTVIVQNPEKEYPSFAARKAVSTGGTQLALGVLAIIFQISATAIEAEHGSAAGGIWAGFFVSFILVFILTTCLTMTCNGKFHSNLPLIIANAFWYATFNPSNPFVGITNTHSYILVYGSWLHWSDSKDQKIMLQGTTFLSSKIKEFFLFVSFAPSYYTCLLLSLQITFYGIFSLIAFLCATALLILAAIGVDNDQESKWNVCEWEFVFHFYIVIWTEIWNMRVKQQSRVARYSIMANFS